MYRGGIVIKWPKEWDKNEGWPSAHIQNKPSVLYEERQWWSIQDNLRCNFGTTVAKLCSELGGKRYRGTKEEFLPFDEAMAFMHKAGLKNKDEFAIWAKSKNRPDNIPTDPPNIYKNEWRKLPRGKRWGIFLGTDTIAPQHKIFYIQEKAIRVVRYFQKRGFDISTKSKYFEFTKHPDFDVKLPCNPQVVYGSDFVGYPKFLSNGRKSNKKVTTDRVKDLLKSRNFSLIKIVDTGSKCQIYYICNRCNAERNTSYNVLRKTKLGCAEYAYKDRTARNRIKRGFPKTLSELKKQSISMTKKYNIVTGRQWTKAIANNILPDNFPSNPQYTYKDEWNLLGGWGYLLGTGNIANTNRIFRDFASARIFVRSLGFKSKKEFREWAKSKKRPKDIPSNPWGVYKNEFDGIPDFLGYVSKQKINCSDVEMKKMRETLSYQKIAELFDVTSGAVFQYCKRRGI